MEKDLISVIIPMYNTEKFLNKCLDSICSQSYKNLEILCVDDGSPDKCAEIAQSYAEKDKRVKLIRNPKNLGLFRARVEGMKVARGKYIAHVDSDDYISIDWLRLLHKKASQENADMTLGNTINVNESGVYDYYNNYRSLTKSYKTIKKDSLLSTFFNQEGSCFVWHTIWNKLYSKRLINECLPYFEKVDFHLIMGEDIAFSSVLYSHANKLAFANVDGYFYYRHSQASTSTSLPLEKIIKNIKDLKKVFDYLENSLQSYDKTIYLKHLSKINDFKSRYHRIWSGNVYAKNAQNNKDALDAMKYTFGKDQLILPNPHEFYFYELTTPWSNRFENIKKHISQDKIKVVSFDIFDTLVKRPMYQPEDLLLFVGKFASTLIPATNSHSFLDMRRTAEAHARQKLKLIKPMYQDVTLTEIYNSMAEVFDIDTTITNQIKAEEERLEIKYCSTRECSKEIFEFALAMGKKVVIVSDMYLEKSIVEEILRKNGYKGYDKLYLSSDKRALKATGKLFDIMLSEVNANPNEIVHIGDNWNIDYLSAQSKGMNVIFLPKTIETFENKISDIYTGNGTYPYSSKKCDTIDSTYAKKQLPIRCMLGVVANEIFDNPFTPYQTTSIFNADTYNTGYYTLGMHLFGVAKWILDTSKVNGYKNIVFLERDGHILKEIFDHLCKTLNVDIKTDSFYATRRALMPYSIKSKSDLINICVFIDIKEHTPLDILDFCSIILNPLTEELKEEYFKNGIILDSKFSSKKEYYNFIKVMSKLSFNESLLKEKRTEAESAFAKVFPENTATFDIGYSGRLQSIICDLAGKPVDTFFIHSNGSNTIKNTKYNFKVNSYYDFTPTITGIIREFMISNPAPSCVGYDIKDDVITPILEDKVFPYETTYALLEFQKGALHFCEKLINIFGDEINDFVCRAGDVSAAFEYYLLNAPEFDRYTFSASMIEDNVYSGYDAKNLFETWTWHLNQLDRNIKEVYVPQQINKYDSMQNYLSKCSKFKKALFYFIFEPKTFWKKLFKKNKNK